MTEYAVFWRDSAVPASFYGGGLAVEADRVSLRGSDGGSRVQRAVPPAELASVGLAGGADSIAGFPTLKLDLCDGSSIVLAVAVGAAALADLLDTLLALLPTV
jgi:hypothetical protein